MTSVGHAPFKPPSAGTALINRTLPPEIFQYILSYLTIPQRAIVLRVSRLWYASTLTETRREGKGQFKRVTDFFLSKLDPVKEKKQIDCLTKALKLSSRLNQKTLRLIEAAADDLYRNMAAILVSIESEIVLDDSPKRDADAIGKVAFYANTLWQASVAGSIDGKEEKQQAYFDIALKLLDARHVSFAADILEYKPKTNLSERYFAFVNALKKEDFYYAFIFSKKIDDPLLRAKAFRQLSSRLIEYGKLDSAFKLTREMPEVSEKYHQIKYISQHYLKQSHFDEALNIISCISDIKMRSEALKEVVRKLVRSHLIEKAREVAETVSDPKVYEVCRTIIDHQWRF